MATGEFMFEAGPLAAIGPSTDYAVLDERAGGSTPPEALPCADFDDTTAEYLDFEVSLPPNYDGGGLSLALEWAATTATSGAVVWRAAFRRIVADDDDIDDSHTYDFNQASADTAPGTCGQESALSIAFTDGADMDSLGAGEKAILRVGRLPTDGGDTMVGDAELRRVYVTEA